MSSLQECVPPRLPPLAREAPARGSFAPRQGQGLNLILWLLGGYVFFLPVQYETAVINLAPSDLFIVLCFVLALRKIRIVRSSWSVFHPALLLMFIIAAFLAFDRFGALTPYIAVKVVGMTLLLASYLCVTSAATGWWAARALLRVFVVATALHGALAVGIYLTEQSFPWINYGTERVSGMLLDPNAFGGLVMVALVVNTVTLLSAHPLLSPMLGAGVSIVLAVALILTFSRSAWIGLGAALLVIAAFRPSLLAAYAALGLGAVLVVFLLLEGSQESRALQLAERPDTAQQRLVQIREALPLFTESPLFGIGLGEFDVLTKGNPTVLRRPYIIHNTTVWVMTELGLVGMSIFLGLMLSFVRKGAAAYKLAEAGQKPLILGLLGAHAGMLGVSAGIEALYQRHWWLVMALLAASYTISKRDTGGAPGRI